MPKYRWEHKLKQFDDEQLASDKHFRKSNILIGVHPEKFDTLKNVPLVEQEHNPEITKIKRAYKPVKKSMMSEPDSYFNGQIHEHLDLLNLCQKDEKLCNRSSSYGKVY